MRTFNVPALATLVLLAFFSGNSFAENSAQTSANAIVTIRAGISIVNDSDLDFGTMTQGDAAQTVLPAAGAQFTVTGEPSPAYTITLPAKGTVIMSTGGGGSPQTEIAVDTFTSTPAVTGALSGGGTQVLGVGATTAAILGNQTTGAYTGSFNVDVAY